MITMAEVGVHRHLLGLDGLPREPVVALLDRSQELLDVARRAIPPLDTLRRRTLVNVFFEPSTRTRCSFTFAARNLGAEVIDVAGAVSSISKGETLLDTCRNLRAMGADGFIIRTAAAGGPHIVARHLDAPVINAGDGRHEHPTQGLLDLLTLRQRLGDLDGRHIGIVGDIANSRVARSAIFGLTTLGVRVTLIGPPRLVPRLFEHIETETGSGDGRARTGSIRVERDLDRAIPELDAIMMLRVQFEREAGRAIASIDEYRRAYQLNRDRLSRLREGAPVLHPGPINRGLELESAVADHTSQSAVMDQVTNGVAVRMAVLEWALGSAE